MDATLQCYACGARYDTAERGRCSCGEPCWFALDASDFTWPSDAAPAGMWRYTDLLPIDSPHGIGSTVGGTPLVRTKRLDDLGCRVFVKDETRQPTGSFKDRGSAVGVAHAVANGTRWVGTVSHGNMATSMAAHAAALGLGCVVLVPADIPAERLVHVARYGPTIVRIDGDYGDCYEKSLSMGPELGIEFVNSDVPLRVAGQKTVALEILEAFAPSSPDAIVLPVSSGGQASAVWKAFLELDAAGLIDSVPRVYGVQSAGCDPIVRAFEAGSDRVSPIEPDETVAYSIANANPPSGTRVLAALRETGGGTVAVTDEEILDAQDRLARDVGLCVEPASATVVAGVERLCSRGALDSDEDVVLIATGTGFRESARITSVVEAEETLTKGIDELRSTLESVIRRSSNRSDRFTV